MNWRIWKNNIHEKFTEELVQKWQIKGFDCEKARRLVSYSYEPDDLEYVDYLIGNYHSLDNLLNSLPNEIKEKGAISLVHCYSWEDSNKYIAIAGINENKNNGKKGVQKKHWRFVDLLIYDGVEEKPYHIEIISGFFNLEETKGKFELFKQGLESNNPILALLRKGEKDIYLSEVIKDIELGRGNVNKDPDRRIKSHDIISIKMDGRHGLKHAAVYLSDKKVAHISRREGESINSLKAQKDNWENFLESHGEAEGLQLNRPIVPFKRSGLIEEHIDVAIATEYGLGKYNLLSENCEHFATLCVRGIPFSEQVSNFLLFGSDRKLEKKKTWKEIEKSSREFAKLRIEVWLKAGGTGRFEGDVNINTNDLPNDFREYQNTLNVLINPSNNNENIDYQKEINYFLQNIKQEIAILHIAKYLENIGQRAEDLPDAPNLVSTYRDYQNHIRGLKMAKIDVFVVEMTGMIRQRTSVQAQIIQPVYGTSEGNN